MPGSTLTAHRPALVSRAQHRLKDIWIWDGTTGNRFSPNHPLANDDQAHTDSGGVANSCLFPKDTVSRPRRRHLDSKSDRVSLYKLQRCLQGSPADCCGPNLIKSPPPSKSNCVRLKTRCSVTKCATTGV